MTVETESRDVKVEWSENVRDRLRQKHYAGMSVGLAWDIDAALRHIAELESRLFYIIEGRP